MMNRQGLLAKTLRTAALLAVGGCTGSLQTAAPAANAGESGTGGLGAGGVKATTGAVGAVGAVGGGGKTATGAGGRGAGGAVVLGTGGGGGDAGGVAIPEVYPGKTYYVATDGSDTSDGSTTKPWATFAHAFSKMVAGDTLLIRDGSYNQVIHSYYGDGFPSGKPNAWVAIKAEHDWMVTAHGALRISPSSIGYFRIQGINFWDNPQEIECNHAKFVRDSFRGSICTDNTTVMSIGTGSSYVLVEECFAYGCGRYKFMAYGDSNTPTENIIFRRCVARHDYHEPAPGWGRQCATFTAYTAHNFVMQNCIAIDSGNVDPSLYGQVWGGVWLENKEDTGKDNSAVIQDSIMLNLATAGINDPKNNGTRVIDNTVIWGSQGGYDGDRISGTPHISLNHMTIGKLWGTFGDESHSWGTGVSMDTALASGKVTNSSITECNSYGAANYAQSDYNVYSGNTKDFGNSYGVAAPKAGAHDRFVNPQRKYIVRAEAGSPLKGTASDGGDVGATIMNRRGVTGSLYGEPGYASLTSEPLWPFPNEAVIKSTMSAWDGKNDPHRGFCAAGNGLYGGPITLTSYIWEYLGNACPADICPR